MTKARAKNFLFAAIVCVVAAVVLHSYLSYHYFILKFGESSRSICDINATFDCDSVAASSYASFLTIPIALWGAVTNLMLLLVLLGAYLFPPGYAERLRRFCLWLTLGVVVASLVMMTISFTQMSTYCLFCLSLYVLSFLTLLFVWLAQDRSPWTYFVDDIQSLFGEYRTIFFFLVFVPVGAWLINGVALNNFQANAYPALIASSLSDWQGNPTQHFDLQGHKYLTMGPPANKAVMNIVEFADFRCSHCREAAPKLHAFVRSHPDVRFTFQSFPLDGDCNSKVPNHNGISCRLAKAVYCSIPSGHGWELHDEVFEHQEMFMSVESVDSELKVLCDQLKIDWAQVEKCMTSDETHQEIMRQADRGNNAGVEGTPTIFVNGRQLPGGQLIPVLDAVYSALKK